MDPFQGSFRYLRFTSVSQPDLAGHLPFPCNAEPTQAQGLSTTATHSPEQLASDPSNVAQVLHLLNQTDVSFLKCRQANNRQLEPVGPLERALVRLNPDVFRIELEDLDRQPQQHRQVSQQLERAPSQQPKPAVAGLLKRQPSKGSQDQVIQAPKHPSKKRKQGDGTTSFVQAPDQPTNIAERFNTALDAFLANFVEDTDEAVIDENDTGTTACSVTAEQLAVFSETVMHVSKTGAMCMVDAGKLQELLKLLIRPLTSGLGKIINEDDNGHSETFQDIMRSIEAMALSLHILTSPDMPSKLYIQEVIEKLVELLKYHLQHNVLVFLDPRFRRQWRGSAVEADHEEDISVPKKPSKLPKTRLRGGLQKVQDRLVAAIQLMTDLLGLKTVECERLLPLIRIALQSLTIEGAQTLQVNAIGMAVAMFRRYDQQRQALLDEVFGGVVSNLSFGKTTPRHFLVSEDRAHIQMIVALLLQMLQASAVLPLSDADDQAILSCCNIVSLWCDKVCVFIFDRLPQAKAQKADTQIDFKLFVEHFLADTLSVLQLPEWPIAGHLLLRFVAMLSSAKGLKHPDSNVKTLCIDFLGLIVTQLSNQARLADEEQKWVEELLLAAGSMSAQDEAAAAERLQQLLMDHLASQAGALAGSAHEFMCCQMLGEMLKTAKRQHQEPSAEQLSDMLQQARALRDRQQSSHHASTSAGDALALDHSQAAKVARALAAQSTLFKVRGNMLKWLMDAGDRTRQDVNMASVRCKAIKTLGGVIENEVALLGMAEVRAGVQMALQDDSVSVREAAVDLIGRYIVTSPDIAAAYFDIVARAAADVGASVRKRAVRVLWECCVRCPGFPRATEGIVRVLHAGGDPEDPMHPIVTKLCSELWFLSDGHSGVGWAAQRSGQLGEVALALYEAGGKSIHVPLPTDNTLVTVLREALGLEGRQDFGPLRKGARSVAAALLQTVLDLQHDSELPSADKRTFQCLLALHALCLADVSVCVDSRDPGTHVRSLAPYLKREIDPRWSQEEKRMSAECMICILSIITAFAQHLPHMEEQLSRELIQDIVVIINKHSYVQVVAVACKCLCTVATQQPSGAEDVASLIKRSLLWPERSATALERCISLAVTQQQPTQLTPEENGVLSKAPRFMYTLGQLSRHAQPLLAGRPDAAAVAAEPCLHQLVRLYKACAAARATRVAGGMSLAEESELQKCEDAALQAMGMLWTARPDLILSTPDVMDILQAGLHPDARPQIKLKALGTMVDMLKSEEDGMMSKQKAEQEAATQVQAGAAPKEAKALAKRVGEGDGSSICSGIIQQLWPRIERLAQDVPRAPAMSPKSPASDATGTGIRSKALELIEVSLRNGVVAPWMPARALVALVTDPEKATSAKALTLLRNTVKKWDMAANGLGPGMQDAFSFQCRLASLHPGDCGPSFLEGIPGGVVERLASMYTMVVQEDNKLKGRFLASLLKPFEDACSMAGASKVEPSSAAAHTELQMLCFYAYTVAQLPYRRADEPLALVCGIRGILDRRGGAVLDELRGVLGQQQLDVAEHPDVKVELPGLFCSSSALASAAKAGLAVSMLLVLDQFLRAAYALPLERLAAFASGSSERRRQEERAPVACGRQQFALASRLHLQATQDTAAALQQLQLLGKLMDQYMADHHLTSLDHNEEAGEHEAGVGGSPGPSAGLTSPAFSNGLQLYSIDGKKRGRGGRPPGRGKSGGASTEPKARKPAAARKRRRLTVGSDDEDDAEAEDTDYTPVPRHHRESES